MRRYGLYRADVSGTEEEWACLEDAKALLEVRDWLRARSSRTVSWRVLDREAEPPHQEVEWDQEPWDIAA